MICGGFSDEKPVDEECKTVIQNVKNELLYEPIEVLSYRTQVVNGTNYLIKTKINQPKFYFVKIHKSLDNQFKIIEHLLNDK